MSIYTCTLVHTYTHVSVMLCLKAQYTKYHCDNWWFPILNSNNIPRSYHKSKFKRKITSLWSEYEYCEMNMRAEHSTRNLHLTQCVWNWSGNHTCLVNMIYRNLFSR